MTIILFWAFFAIMGALSSYSGFHWLAAACYVMFGGVTGALYVFWQASKVITLPGVLEAELKALEAEILREQGKIPDDVQGTLNEAKAELKELKKEWAKR